MTSAAPSPLSEREWEKLLNILSEGRVVPVVGPEALVSTYNGREELLYKVWGRLLAEQEGWPDGPREQGTSALYEVTNRLSKDRSSNDLAYDIDDIVRRKPWPIPDILRRLAEIRSFSLYITTTIDHLLRGALREARPDQQERLQDIVFAPGGDKNHIDLPTDFDYSPDPTVFHLFGATSSLEGTFAKTEDDLIEFSWCLLDKQYAPERLYDYLQKKTVLLLGCSFPDWLARFFIHALNAGRREETINIYYVSNYCEDGLAAYLLRKRARVMVPQSPLSFVEELHRRWHLRKNALAEDAASPAPRPVLRGLKPGSVFLSYASEDRAIVRKVRDQLEAANIDTWMDESGLEPGVEYQQTIRESIRNASFFIAVISRSLNTPDKLQRFLWREWKWAEDANLERRKESRFLQPVVIDDTPPGASFVDSPYQDLHWTVFRDGRLPEHFLDMLSQGIRRHRRAK